MVKEEMGGDGPKAKPTSLLALFGIGFTGQMERDGQC